MFEQKDDPLISHQTFAGRIFRCVLVVSGFMSVSLAIGMTGFHHFENYSWVDAFLNAAMLLGGMGQVSPIVTDEGKLFAGLYALYAGVMILASVGVILAPVLHRILHSFHIDMDE